jgi:hypothetical protein
MACTVAVTWIAKDGEHFQRLGFGDAIPRLLERRREFYAPMVD